MGPLSPNRFFIPSLNTQDSMFSSSFMEGGESIAVGFEINFISSFIAEFDIIYTFGRFFYFVAAEPTASDMIFFWVLLFHFGFHIDLVLE
jgi:hypothetical protein